MELMGVVGIIVNCALIGQSGIIHRMFPNITGTQTIILIIVLEVRGDSCLFFCSFLGLKGVIDSKKSKTMLLL